MELNFTIATTHCGCQKKGRSLEYLVKILHTAVFLELGKYKFGYASLVLVV